jgi:hypothetical protein
MIKFTRLFITLLLAVIVFQVKAQQTTATTSSPYSRYGLGLLTSQALPQNIGMGGLGAAVNNFSGFYNVNPVNPASYGALPLTVIDAGIYGNITTLSQTQSNGSNLTQSNGNFRFDHVNFAFPVTRHSALSFGLQPYSQMGYNYKTTQKNLGTNSVADTNAVNYIYSGNGDLSKAYIGYGFGIGKHLLVGANASYIFGKLQQYSSTEIPTLYGTLDSRVENSYSIGGGSYDLGAQYTIDLAPTKHVILGYSTTLSSSLNSQYTYIVSQYDYDGSGNENIPLDTLNNTQTPKTKLKIPMTNHFGVTYMSDGKYLVGAEYTSANWSSFSIGGVNQGLQNSKTYNLGGQITPNINALNNYWATLDYRLGFIYNQSYVNVNNATNNTNTSINSYSVTFGLGLPLAPTNTSFYKINFAAEVGRQGTLNNGLVRENYVNLHLSFTLNDRWFQKYKIQ